MAGMPSADDHVSEVRGALRHKTVKGSLNAEYGVQIRCHRYPRAWWLIDKIFHI
jgi:hypothetical protein